MKEGGGVPETEATPSQQQPQPSSDFPNLPGLATAKAHNTTTTPLPRPPLDLTSTAETSLHPTFTSHYPHHSHPQHCYASSTASQHHHSPAEFHYPSALSIPLCRLALRLFASCPIRHTFIVKTLVSTTRADTCPRPAHSPTPELITSHARTSFACPLHHHSSTGRHL